MVSILWSQKHFDIETAPVESSNKERLSGGELGQVGTVREKVLQNAGGGGHCSIQDGVSFESVDRDYVGPKQESDGFELISDSGTVQHHRRGLWHGIVHPKGHQMPDHVNSSRLARGEHGRFGKGWIAANVRDISNEAEKQVGITAAQVGESRRALLGGQRLGRDEPEADSAGNGKWTTGGRRREAIKSRKKILSLGTPKGGTSGLRTSGHNFLRERNEIFLFLGTHRKLDRKSERNATKQWGSAR